MHAHTGPAHGYVGVCCVVRVCCITNPHCWRVLCWNLQVDFETVGFSPHWMLDLPTWLDARQTMLGVLAGKTAHSELARYPPLHSSLWWQRKKAMRGSWGAHGCAAVDPYVYCVGGECMFTV